MLQNRAHSGPVTDIAWSPDDTMLASCSLDNLVCVWDASGTLLRRLDGHSSFVKGVSWDPIGKYLASQSDDKSVALWRTEDWGRAAVVTEPFAKSTGSCFNLRLGFSPDGSVLTAANSHQGANVTAAARAPPR